MRCVLHAVCVVRCVLLTLPYHGVMVVVLGGRVPKQVHRTLFMLQRRPAVCRCLCRALQVQPLDANQTINIERTSI